MTILIVDDLQVVVSGIYFGIDWEALGIREVYTATSAQDARSVFARHPIDIMLCDIDMPGENGLSLFQWVKAEGYHTECIFLTSHDNFIYVKKAFLIGGFDYILQPARYEEIEQAVTKIIAHIHAQKQKQQYESYGKMFFSEMESVKALLANNWYEQKICFSEFVHKVNTAGIPLQVERGGYLLLMSFAGNPEERTALLSYISKYILDYLYPKKYDILDSEIGSSHHLFLITPAAELALIPDRMEDCLHGLYDHIHTLFCHNVAFYADAIKANCDFNGADEALKRLKLALENNVSLKPGIFFPGASKKTSDSKAVFTINTRRLSELLGNGDFDEFSAVCKSFISSLARQDVMDKGSLKIFHISLLQLYYQSLDLYTPIESEVLKTEEYDINRCPKNIQEAYEFTDYISMRLQCLLAAPQKEEKHIERIIHYIHTHIDDNLKRTDIAAAVYLTPDYVTKLFKEEMGVSLKEYILHEKINIARDRLHTTNMTVEEIAAKGGFTNFSHFSQVYKRITGISPNRDRKKKLTDRRCLDS